MPRLNENELNELLAIETEDIAKMQYEAALELLEKVVSALEQEGTPLESATQLYMLGNVLAKRCGMILDSTEEKMLKLLGEAEEGGQEPFDPERDGR